LYKEWLETTRQDKGIEILMAEDGLTEQFIDLPETAEGLLAEVLVGLRVADNQIADYAHALLLDANGWASWVAYLRWQDRLSGEENGYGKFLRTSAKLGLYYGLNDWIDYDLILRFKARATMINSGDNEKLPIAEKLYMGGVGSVRGYDAYSLTPLADPNDLNSRIGGKKRASATIEASIPLSEAAKMRLAFFYDYGMIGEESFNEITRSGVGAVIEWQSAFGPINLVFAKALDDKPGDRTSTFEFSMGTKF